MFFLASGSITETFPSDTESGERDAELAESPTEEVIQKLIDDHQLYQDPCAKAVITHCHGRTPLHVAVTEKHEAVVNCFIDFQGILCFCDSITTEVLRLRLHRHKLCHVSFSFTLSQSSPYTSHAHTHTHRHAFTDTPVHSDVHVITRMP